MSESVATDTRRYHAATVWLSVCSLAGVVGVLKGFRSSLVDGSEFYWLLTYGHGFVRRALIGTLVRPVLAVVSFDQLKPTIVAAHFAACVGIIAGCFALFWRAVVNDAHGDNRITLVCSLLCVMCGPLMATLAHDVGYVDVYIILLALAGFWLVLHEWYVAAAISAMVGPLIHEAFVFLWLPVAIMLAWSSVRSKKDVPQKLLAASLPAVMAAAVVLLQNPVAAAAAIDALPLSGYVKDGLKEYQIGQTIRDGLGASQYQFRDNLDHFAISATYFLLPAAATLWSAAFCYWQQWSHRGVTLVVMVAATLSPLLVLAFAWDLSRFLVWSNLAGAMVLVGSGSPALIPGDCE